jgi:UDP-3-O-[3-hydroxymyristoyl] glucosamine N-acyltransferase
MSVSLEELAVRFGCELRGDPEARVEHVATLANADRTALAFLANPRYRPQLATTRAAAVVLDAEAAACCPANVLLAENPYATYARIAAVLHPRPAAPAGVHPTALIAPGARIDPSAHIGAFSSVGERAVIAERCVVGPYCLLEEDVKLAADVRLAVRVIVHRGVEIGARTVLQSGAVLGGDGFGYAPERGTWVKVPQIGAVLVGADVEIGCNTTIDRGAIEDTVIEDGVKLDNLIQIGHNVRVGAHTAIAACTGVSGSTVIGRRCMIGGHVGFAGHISIADDVVITGFSAVSRSITAAGVYSSTIPFEEAHAWRRLVARFKRSGLLAERVRKLERAAGLRSSQEEEDS